MKKKITLIDRILNKIKRDGPFDALHALVSLAVHKIKWRIYGKKLEKSNSTQEKFDLIYSNNMWGSSESVSGFGSTLKYTENIRKQIPQLISSLGIESILDAPCGDFNWMKEVVKNVPEVTYIGADIVGDLVLNNQKKYSSTLINFVHLDIVNDVLPSADLMICRDCLFHLCESDIIKFLKNFCRSEIKYLLTTSHDNDSLKFKNVDIDTGGFRLIDLFGSPYNIGSDYIARIEDWIEPEPKRWMYLWSKSSIESVVMKSN